MECKVDKFKLFESLSKFKWNIEFLGDSADEKQFPIEQIIPIEIGDFFKFLTKEAKTVTEVTLTKPKEKSIFDLPFFLCLSPIWFVDRDVLYLTFITGDKICGLRKVAFRFDELNTDKPKFFFSIDPSSDCECGDCCKGKSSQGIATFALVRSEPQLLMHSMGGGSGEIDV